MMSDPAIGHTPQLANDSVLAGLTPAQVRIAVGLLGLGEERPVADLDWASELADWIDDALTTHSGGPGPTRWTVTKASLAGVFGCEAHSVASRGQFAWNNRTAKGTVVHNAIALAAAGGATTSARILAEAAMDEAQRSGDKSLAAWLAGLGPAQRASLIAESVPPIDGFLSAFPPLRPAWNPIAEYPVAATIGDGRVRVSGRVDLALGSNRRDGDRFLRRRRLFIEVKTGASRPEHRAVHLLYALLETLRSGVAPFRAATYYTEDATWLADDITKELLVVARSEAHRRDAAADRAGQWTGASAHAGMALPLLPGGCGLSGAN